MDSPLNRAHQQERKAEKLVSNKKYMDAIACYEIASSYIMEAMEATTASQALISMQLQYEDHLRKKKLLQVKIERAAHAKMKSEDLSQNCDKSLAVEKNNKQHSSDVLQQESNDSSYDMSSQSNQGLQTQADSLEPEKTICQFSIEDLQMQVLTLTQALEDSNRENNHLRNIVIRFKDILHEKFGLTQEEIEEVLIDNETETEQITTSQCNNIDIQKDSPD